jgi:hypothetical protein
MVFWLFEQPKHHDHEPRPRTELRGQVTHRPRRVPWAHMLAGHSKHSRRGRPAYAGADSVLWQMAFASCHGTVCAPYRHETFMKRPD